MGIFDLDAMNRVIRNIQQYVASRSDERYPDEMLSAEQVAQLNRATTALTAYVASEGYRYAAVLGADGLVMRRL